ncbi:MAG: dihydropteroate synthase [Opitutales bacterium]
MSWSSPHGTPLPDWRARTLIMGVVNVTPDSFSDGGLALDPESAADQAERLAGEGADVIDVGGESTRPGAAPVDARTELGRLLPALKAIRLRLPRTPISIDTYRATTAAACVEAGADIVNDVEGGRHEAGAAGSPMGSVCARLRCPLILMHRRQKPDYADFWTEVVADLRDSIRRVTEEGVPPGQLWTDPGFGFGKTPAQNLMLVRDLSRIAALGHPVLLGTSRKSTLGLVLGREDPKDRHEGDAVTAAWGVAQGCSMIRVHDVARIRPYVRMADAIRAGRTP